MIPRLQFFFPILLSSFLLLSGIMHLQGGGVDRMAYVGGNPPRVVVWFGTVASGEEVATSLACGEKKDHGLVV